MVAINPYVTTENVRAALGLEESDIEDEVFIDSGLAFEVEFDLDKWLPNHTEIFAGDDPKKKGALTQYCQWYCVAEVVRRRLLFPQVVTDGKVRQDYFKDLDFSEIIGNAEDKMAKFKDFLLESTKEDLVPIKFCQAAAPDYNLITNKGA